MNIAISDKLIPMNLEHQYYFIIVSFGSTSERKGILKPNGKGHKRG